MPDLVVCPYCGSVWSQLSHRRGLGERVRCHLTGVRPVRCRDCSTRYFITNDKVAANLPYRYMVGTISAIIAVMLLRLV